MFFQPKRNYFLEYFSSSNAENAIYYPITSIQFICHYRFCNAALKQFNLISLGIEMKAISAQEKNLVCIELVCTTKIPNHTKS